MTGGWRRVLVVFSDARQPGWLRLLRPGFRHVFLVFEAEDGWLQYEPMSHCTELLRHPPAGYDLAAAWRAQGHAVVETLPRPAIRRCLPWRPYTCVEAVKRLLGLRAPWVLTPWQLYRRLVQENIP